MQYTLQRHHPSRGWRTNRLLDRSKAGYEYMHRHTIVGVGGPLSVGGLVIGHRRRLARPPCSSQLPFYSCAARRQ